MMNLITESVSQKLRFDDSNYISDVKIGSQVDGFIFGE